MKALLFALALASLPGPQAQVPASLEGLVVQLGTSAPVAGAQVSIGRAQATTDENGKFAFANVQPGRYRILANHTAYMPAQYGERSRGGVGADVTVAPGQVLKDIVIVLAPRGTILGRVYDASDKPVANANVQALKYAYQEGREIVFPVVPEKGTDVEKYRPPSLTPGPYIISPVPRAVAPADPADRPLPVYYPGTTDAGAASTIDLPPGIEFTG